MNAHLIVLGLAIVAFLIAAVMENGRAGWVDMVFFALSFLV